MSNDTAGHAPGWEVPAGGGPWTAPQSVPELPGYWRARAAGAQRGAHVRSVDYQRGAVFRRCADDLEGALASEGDLTAVAAERDRLARQLADLRTSLDYAAGQWAANAMPHTHPARSAEYRRVMAECARDLRYALRANAPDAADVRAELEQALADLQAAREALFHIGNRDPEILGPDRQWTAHDYARHALRAQGAAPAEWYFPPEPAADKGPTPP